VVLNVTKNHLHRHQHQNLALKEIMAKNVAEMDGVITEIASATEDGLVLHVNKNQHHHHQKPALKEVMAKNVAEMDGVITEIANVTEDGLVLHVNKNQHHHHQNPALKEMMAKNVAEMDGVIMEIASATMDGKDPSVTAKKIMPLQQLTTILWPLLLLLLPLVVYRTTFGRSLEFPSLLRSLLLSLVL